MPPLDNVDRLIERVPRKTRHAVIEALELALADRRARPTAHECMEAATIEGGDPYACGAAWGWVQDSRDGRWLDVLSVTGDENVIGLVPSRTALCELTAFFEHFNIEPCITIRVGAWPAISTARAGTHGQSPAHDAKAT